MVYAADAQGADVDIAAICLLLVLLYAGAALAARRQWGAQHRAADLVVVLGAIGLGAALALLIGQASADIDLTVPVAAMLAGAFLLLGAFLFLRNHALPSDLPAAKHSSMTNLAVSLMTGGAVALVLFVLENAHSERAERLQDEEFRAQQQADFQLAVALAPDLTGFTPPRDAEDGRPLDGPFSMVGLHLSGKKLANASLNDVDMRRSNLVFTHLSGGRLRSADLQDARMRGAYAHYADLRCACLAGALLDDADLSNADLRGADLRRASLRRTDLRGVLVDEDTLWPEVERQGGVCRASGDRSCGREARRTWGQDDEFVLRADRPGKRDCTPVRDRQR